VRHCLWQLDQPFFLGKPSLKHDCSGVALTRNFRVFMYDPLWNPVLFAIYIAEQREKSMTRSNGVAATFQRRNYD